MGTVPRPLPSAQDPDSALFWNATKEERLTYGYCPGCDAVVFFLRTACPRCGADVEVRDSRGEGTIYTVTVVRRTGDPAFRPRVPYAVALVDLDEGFRIMTEIVDFGETPPRIGERVALRWELHENLNFPVFAPLPERQGSHEASRRERLLRRRQG